MWRFWIKLVPLALLAGCAGAPQNNAPQPGRVAASTPSWDSIPAPTQCAPFVREIAGLPLYGDAWTWWEQAANHYARAQAPKEQSVLVLRATSHVKAGHVAMVRRVVGPREITVTHTNWGTDPTSRRLVYDSMPVIDVSPKNDWTQLRFWNATTSAFGKIYDAYGFIIPKARSDDLRPVW